MRFEDCYPQEIVDWINTFPHPDECTTRQRDIVRRIESPDMIAAGQRLLQKLRDATCRQKAQAMIERFQNTL